MSKDKKSIIWFGTPGVPERIVNKIIGLENIIEKQFLFSEQDIIEKSVSGILVKLNYEESLRLRSFFTSEFLKYMLIGKFRDHFTDVNLFMGESHIVVRPYNEEYRELFDTAAYSEDFHPIIEGIELFYTDKYRDFKSKEKQTDIVNDKGITKVKKEQIYMDLFEFSRPTYFKRQREKNKAFELVNKYFTLSDLQEFLNTGKIAKLEAFKDSSVIKDILNRIELLEEKINT